MEIFPRVVALVYPTRYSLGHAIIRISGFYESQNDNFRGKYFTIDEVEEWEARRYGCTVFDIRWRGYNIPGKVVDEWESIFRQHEKKLRYVEEDLISMIRSTRPAGNRPFYVIAVSTDTEKEVLNHELSHAFFYLDAGYKKYFSDLLGKIPASIVERDTGILKTRGYANPVIDDELVAYYSTRIPEFRDYFESYISKFSQGKYVSILGRFGDR